MGWLKKAGIIIGQVTAAIVGAGRRSARAP